MDSILPVGPMLPATQQIRPAASAQRRAMEAAASLISAAKRLRLYSSSEMALALNVFVSIMSAPAERYARWMSATTSGRVSESKSLHPCRFFGWVANRLPLKSASVRPYCCICVPMAPSSTRMRSDRACCSWFVRFNLYLSLFGLQFVGNRQRLPSFSKRVVGICDNDERQRVGSLDFRFQHVCLFVADDEHQYFFIVVGI